LNWIISDKQTLLATLYFLALDLKIGGAVVNKTIKFCFQASPIPHNAEGLLFADSVSFAATQRSSSTGKNGNLTPAAEEEPVPDDLVIASNYKSKKRKRDVQVTSVSASSPTESYEPPPSPPSQSTTLTVVAGDLNIDGTARARAFLQYSDIRLKTDVIDVVDALETISKLKGVSYRWKPGVKHESENAMQRVMGLIAQDVQHVLPNIVRQDAEGWLSVAYTEIIPILIEACKELMKNVSSTRADISVMGTKLDSLSRVVDSINAGKDVGVSSSQLMELKAELRELRKKSRPSLFLPLKKRPILWAAAASMVGVAIAIAIILGAVLSTSRTSASSPPQSPIRPPQPGTSLCDDCNSLFAFEPSDWSPNRLINPSFESPNAVDPTLALGWEASEATRPYTLLRTPVTPSPFDGQMALNVSSIGSTSSTSTAHSKAH
jgi:hypothetical protein